MRRREFIALLGGAASVWPAVAQAQQAGRRIGALITADENDRQANVAALRKSLQDFGWVEGRNIQIDYRWGARPLATIVSFAVIVLVIGLRCAGAEECDYKTCGELMARDGSVSWSVSGRRDYAPDTKRACAELNACVRRAKNDMAKRAPAAPAAKSGSLESSRKDSGTESKLESTNKQANGMPLASPRAIHRPTTHAVPGADDANGKPARCFAVAEILVPIDCSPGGPPSGR
jgi:hypothetical protein